MHWALKTAHALIEEHPEREIFVLASGISPSGSIHMGNFREVVTTYFVKEALEYLGKKTRFILSWDDFDRFRKVPAGLPEHYNQYLGMPYTQVPDPSGSYASYAAYYEKEFEEVLNQFGIHPEMRYQSDLYQSGQYSELIIDAMNQRQVIGRMIKGEEVALNDYYPVTVYCRRCLKAHTKILAYDEIQGSLEYQCQCGHHEITELCSYPLVKLDWKVDWPMRWSVEDVHFEPGGKDHSSAGGSFEKSSEIVRQVFHHEPPMYLGYEFIGIKGSDGKMSSSTGKVMTPDELLCIYPPQMILYMYARFLPDHAFDIGLDDDVIRQYSEFERMLNRREALEEDYQFALYLSTQNKIVQSSTSFSQIAALLPLLAYDHSRLIDVLKPETIEEEIEINIKATRCQYWINHYVSHRQIQMNQEMPSGFSQHLTEDDRRWLHACRELVASRLDYTSDTFMDALYAIPNHQDLKVRRQQQKRFFKLLYGLFLNQTFGPKINLLIDIVGQSKAVSLMDQSLESVYSA